MADDDDASSVYSRSPGLVEQRPQPNHRRESPLRRSSQHIKNGYEASAVANDPDVGDDPPKGAGEEEEEEEEQVDVD
ncbi:hypothetical protein VTN96DRAFT_1291 [Rasamsonia emersonii]